MACWHYRGYRLGEHGCSHWRLKALQYTWYSRSVNGDALLHRIRGFYLMQQPEKKIAALTDALSEVVRGNRECIETLVISLLSGGSVLMQDVPGVGKTTLAKAVAKAIDVQFHRIQFTPDLLPADILGSSIYNPVEGTFAFRAGPVFCNVLWADEINRASPRTQSALLEAMSESHATIEGQRYDLPSPFLVLATQKSCRVSRDVSVAGSATGSVSRAVGTRLSGLLRRKSTSSMRRPNAIRWTTSSPC